MCNKNCQQTMVGSFLIFFGKQEAVNYILGQNPLGVFYKVSSSYDETNWNGNLLPIRPNMIGGILLFSNALEERTDNIYSLWEIFRWLMHLMM